MIKNFIANGCSFTAETMLGNSWASFVGKEFPFYHNLAHGGAGNYYIASSTIEYLETKKHNPRETLVGIMWSGIGRKDLLISGEEYYRLRKDYFACVKELNEQYYLLSGGLAHSWQQHPETKRLFQNIYKLIDPVSVCRETLFEIIKLKGYLESKGYRYFFTSYFDYWNPDIESVTASGDYSIGHFCHNLPIYTNIDQSTNWITTYLGNFAQDSNRLDHTVHPTTNAHQLYASEVVLPFLVHNGHM